MQPVLCRVYLANLCSCPCKLLGLGEPRSSSTRSCSSAASRSTTPRAHSSCGAPRGWRARRGSDRRVQDSEQQRRRPPGSHWRQDGCGAHSGEAAGAAGGEVSTCSSSSSCSGRRAGVVEATPSAPLSLRRSKSYESKIAALSAINSALQKENDQLRRDAARTPLTDAGAP